MLRTVNFILSLLLISLVMLPAGGMTASMPKVVKGPFPVQIFVRAAETNKPVSGALVEFTEDRGNAAIAATMTLDSEGAGTVMLPAGSYRYLIKAEGFGVSRNWIYVDGQERTEGKVWLNKAASLSGRLVDGNGNPLAGFRLVIDDLTAVTSDANGRFSFSNLDAHGHDLKLEQPEWVLENSLYPQMAPGENKKLGDLTLRRAAAVNLLVNLKDKNRLATPAGISVTVNGKNIWRSGKLDAKGRLQIGMLPPGAYTASFSDYRIENNEQKIVLKEGEQQQSVMTAITKPPSLEIEEYGDVILANRVIPVRAYSLWVGSARATVFRIKSESIIDGTVDLARPEQISAGLIKPYKSFDVKLVQGKNDHRHRARFRLPALSPGAYLLRLEGGGATGQIAFLATRLGLVAKSAPDSVLIQAVDLQNGKPLTNVRLHGNNSPQPFLISRKDGITIWDREKQGNRIVGQYNDSLAVLSLAMEEAETGTSEIRGYIYTERTAYRAGQTVFYKGVIRQNSGDDYQLPQIKKIVVKVSDSGDKTVAEETLESSASGSFNGKFTLSALPALGEYTITASNGTEKWQGSFKVLEYRKPEFEVKLKSTGQHWLGGSSIPLALSARYYFGAPVAGAKVVWRVYASSLHDNDSPGGGFGEESYHFGGYSDFIGEGEATLDSNGIANIIVSAKTHDLPVSYTVEADVTDSSNRQVSGSTSFNVVPSLLKVNLKGEQYLLKPGQDSIFVARVSDWQGRTKADQPVQLTIEQQQYDKKSRVYNWLPRKTLEGITGSDGAVRFSYRFPGSGYWRLRAIAVDEGKRPGFDETWTWVWQEGSNWAGSYRELEAEFDKKSYRPGETARLILRAPAVGGSLFLTLEGRRVHQSRIIPITSAVQVVEIPVTAELAPNIYISAITVYGGRFYQQEGLLKVDSQPGKLELEVKPERPVYAPGETARIQIKSSVDGRPSPAELSLALVDEAIFAVAPETREDIYYFFRGKRDHLVRTIHSFPRLYLGGASKDLARLGGNDDLKGIAVRKVFKDTAAWFPILAVNNNGTITAEAVLPDNLTTWRATAVGHTVNQQFGSATSSFISRLPFMARLAPPRFMVAGDQLMIPGLLNDASGKEQQVKGMFESNGLTLLGETVFSGTVPANGSLARDIAVEAKQAGKATLRLSASGTEGQDALELTLPVLPLALQREQTGGVTLTSSTQRDTIHTLPADALADSGTITALFSPTVADSLAPALEKLISYPFGCVEQTVSRFVPAVYAEKLLDEKRQWLSAELKSKLSDILAQGVKLLTDYQHEDGSWGWWKNSPGRPELTALVMQGLATARRAGVTVDEQVIRQGKKALEAQISNATPEQAAILYRALTANGGRHIATEKLLNANHKRLSPEYRIAIAESLENLGRREHAVKLLKGLEPLLQRDASSAWLPGNNDNWHFGSSSVELTAALLSAASRIMPDDPNNPELARYLARHQNGGWWRTTTATATSVIALADFIVANKEAEASYSARLLHNGKQLEQYTVEKGILTSGSAQVAVRAVKGENRLTLEKTGNAGTASLTTDIRFHVAPDQVARNSGLLVERHIYQMRSTQRNGKWQREYQQLKDGDAVQVGDDLEVRLTVKNSKPLEYLILEDHLPAGFEVRQTDRDPRYTGEATYSGWYEHKERRDSTMAWFMSYLPEGSHEFRFVIYPELKGRVTALPGAIWPMYSPELRSESESWQVEIR